MASPGGLVRTFSCGTLPRRAARRRCLCGVVVLRPPCYCCERSSGAHDGAWPRESHGAWESYVYELFDRRPNTPARARQRALALGLPDDQELTQEQATELSPPLFGRTRGPVSALRLVTSMNW